MFMYHYAVTRCVSMLINFFSKNETGFDPKGSNPHNRLKDVMLNISTFAALDAQEPTNVLFRD